MNDGSTDGSGAILDEYAAKDSRQADPLRRVGCKAQDRAGETGEQAL